MTPTSLPPEQRRAVVLHVGTGKTGTSSIQARMHRNRTRLEELGVLYPKTPGKRRHIRLGLAMQPDEQGPGTSLDWRRQDHATPADLRPVFEGALFAELAASPAPSVLFSDEGLYGSTEEGIANLRGLLDRIASSVRVVVYLRRQDDHLCSRYQQVVKRAGEVRTLAERLDEMDFTRLYDYRARLDAWRSIARPDELVVRRFERSRFPGGSLHHDFLDATGLGVTPEQLDEGPTRNESLDAESVEFLRVLNTVTRDDHAEIAGMMTQTKVIRRLERASTGPTLTLPADRLDAFMAQWEEPNRAVAAEFFPEEPDALFEDPRKSRHTTTEQRLDPARVDHFIELLELPEVLHAQLREAAEREAAR